MTTGRAGADLALRPAHDTPYLAEVKSVLVLNRGFESREISSRGKCNVDPLRRFFFVRSAQCAHPITQQCLSRGDPARRIIGKAKRHRGSVSIKGLPSRTIGPRAFFLDLIARGPKRLQLRQSWVSRGPTMDNHRQGATSCTEPGHSSQRAVKSSHGLGCPW